jgi:excinuclease UvrABC nuclease subunit
MSKWIELATPRINIDDIERRPGVYVIQCDDIISYVGSSTNLRDRIKTYQMHYNTSAEDKPFYTRKWGFWRHISCRIKYSERLGDWFMIEHRLIVRLQPPFNTRGVIPTRGRNAIRNR